MTTVQAGRAASLCRHATSRFRVDVGRRVLLAQDPDVELGEFLRLGALTVPAILGASTLRALAQPAMVRAMRALVWVTEDSWEATIAARGRTRA